MRVCGELGRKTAAITMEMTASIIAQTAATLIAAAIARKIHKRAVVSTTTETSDIMTVFSTVDFVLNRYGYMLHGCFSES